MKTVRFNKVGLDVNFERVGDELQVSINVPAPMVNEKLKMLQDFKERARYLPGLGPVYHVISLLEAAIIGALEEPPK